MSSKNQGPDKVETIYEAVAALSEEARNRVIYLLREHPTITSRIECIVKMSQGAHPSGLIFYELGMGRTSVYRENKIVGTIVQEKGKTTFKFNPVGTDGRQNKIQFSNKEAVVAHVVKRFTK